MTPVDSPRAASRLGVLLKHWRSARQLSQLELALQAEMSARHLSFIETGRAQPSREMVARLSDALEVPLRERNAMLLAAGYAPIFSETALDAAVLSQARRAVEFILKQLEPYPAIVVDRHWTLMRSNEGAARIFGWLFDGPPPDANLLRLVFRPDGLRPWIANWEDVARHMMRRLQLECAGVSDATEARSLLAELLAYPDLPKHWHSEMTGSSPEPLLMVSFQKGDRTLRFFTTITTFGTPRDITLEELRIECSYPADDVTDAFCREWAGR